MCSLQGLKKMLKLDKCDTKDGDAGGIIVAGELTQIYGNTRQDFMKGKYVGNQCTTISLAAGIHWLLCEQQGQVPITPEMINVIVHTGHNLHTELRDGLRLSKIHDSRIAIDELPRSFVTVGNLFNKIIRFKMIGDFTYVFTTPKDFAGFGSLYEHLGSHVPMWSYTYLITITDFSFAVCKSPTGNWSLFDSHGMFGRDWFRTLEDMASVFKFEDLKSLCDFLSNRIGKELLGMVMEIWAEEHRSARLRPTNLIIVKEADRQHRIRNEDEDTDAWRVKPVKSEQHIVKSVKSEQQIVKSEQHIVKSVKLEEQHIVKSVKSEQHIVKSVKSEQHIVKSVKSEQYLVKSVKSEQHRVKIEEEECRMNVEACRVKVEDLGVKSVECVRKLGEDDDQDSYGFVRFMGCRD